MLCLDVKQQLYCFFLITFFSLQCDFYFFWSLFFFFFNLAFLTSWSVSPHSLALEIFPSTIPSWLLMSTVLTRGRWNRRHDREEDTQICSHTWKPRSTLAFVEDSGVRGSLPAHKDTSAVWWLNELEKLSRLVYKGRTSRYSGTLSSTSSVPPVSGLPASKHQTFASNLDASVPLSENKKEHKRAQRWQTAPNRTDARGIMNTSLYHKTKLAQPCWYGHEVH